jgi:hypothetical protein
MAFNTWHDHDHRVENQGTIPHIYHSQRWVAPPEYIKARGNVDTFAFPKGGGQYFATYWSTATPEQLLYDTRVLAQELQIMGRNESFTRDMEPPWDDKYIQEWSYMHAVTALAREGLRLSAGAVPLSPHKGILVHIGEVTNRAAGEEWTKWYLAVHVPDLLRFRGFKAFFKFMPMLAEDQHIFIHLFYLNEDPLEVLHALPVEITRLKEGGRYPEDLINRAQKTWMLSPYQPIVMEQYDFYD